MPPKNKPTTRAQAAPGATARAATRPTIAGLQAEIQARDAEAQQRTAEAQQQLDEVQAQRLEVARQLDELRAAAQQAEERQQAAIQAAVAAALAQAPPALGMPARIEVAGDQLLRAATRPHEVNRIVLDEAGLAEYRGRLGAGYDDLPEEVVNVYAQDMANANNRRVAAHIAAHVPVRVDGDDVPGDAGEPGIPRGRMHHRGHGVPVAQVRMPNDATARQRNFSPDATAARVPVVPGPAGDRDDHIAQVGPQAVARNAKGEFVKPPNPITRHIFINVQKAIPEFTRREFTNLSNHIHDITSPVNGIDFSKTFHHQDFSIVRDITIMAAREWPMLKLFEQRWPALAILQQYINNRRRDAQRQGVLPLPPPRAHRRNAQERRAQAQRAAIAGNRNRRAGLGRADDDLQNVDPAFQG